MFEHWMHMQESAEDDVTAMYRQEVPFLLLSQKTIVGVGGD
jgi:hypothetical protein